MTSSFPARRRFVSKCFFISFFFLNITVWDGERLPSVKSPYRRAAFTVTSDLSSFGQTVRDFCWDLFAVTNLSIVLSDSRLFLTDVEKRQRDRKHVALLWQPSAVVTRLS